MVRLVAVVFACSSVAPAALAKPAPPARDLPAPDDVAAIPLSAQISETGVGYRRLRLAKPSADKPGPRDKVVVHYTGWTTDGKMFDSSVTRGRTASFRLDAVIPGWTEALQRMRVGEKARLWIPEAAAYKGKPGRPAGMLVFDVDLISIERLPAGPVAPADVAKPAKRSHRGVHYRILRRGSGRRAPAGAQFTVHYTGWTTDGKMFDSSVTRGRPASFRAAHVIDGWKTTLPHMRVGEMRRIWIPQALAYKGRAGAPKGMLVFDIEMLSYK